MNYSPNSQTPLRNQLREPLAGDGGISFKPAAKIDLSDWIALMDAVEALCPAWPARRQATKGEFRL